MFQFRDLLLGENSSFMVYNINCLAAAAEPH